MPPPRVLITHPILPAGIEQFRRAGWRIRLCPERRAVSEIALLHRLQPFDALCCNALDPVTRRVIDGVPRLRAIATVSVGFEHIDLAAATARGIPVFFTPGVLTDATADLTWALILAVARRVVEADACVRAGRFRSWGMTDFLGMDLRGKTLGIVGAGRIGQAVGERAVPFGLRLLYAARTGKKGFERRTGARRRTLPGLLRVSDVVSVHVPLLPPTRRLFDAAAFARMKPGAIFINTSRGKVHDEKALAAALRSGRLGGAGLDVFERVPDVVPSLLKMRHVVLLPTSRARVARPGRG
ncbi:MAG: D-glycerate dehydrogenase, partial [Planctomycetes bacterium]|nr:D-glycerate dehydrogenase [Planctomycetota bacterium]